MIVRSQEPVLPEDLDRLGTGRLIFELYPETEDTFRDLRVLSAGFETRPR